MMTALVRIALACSLVSACSISEGATIPTSEDSFSLRGKLTIPTNRAAILPVDGTRRAFVFFDLSGFPNGTQLRYARLRVYFPTVARSAGGLTLHEVTGQWNEATASAEPAFNSAPIVTFAPASIGPKRFVSVDVTGTVQGWLANPASNEGFALAAIPGASAKLTASLTLGAKEGSGSGYPAELDIEIADDPIAEGSIQSGQIAPGAVQAGNIASGAVGTLQLASGAVTASQLFTGAVGTSALADQSVTGAKISPGAVGPLQIANGAVGTNAIADQNVTNAKLAGPIDAAKIGTGSISDSEFAALDGANSNLQAQLDGKLAMTGGTLTGAITLPANGLSLGGNQLVAANGSVGIGTDLPEVPLHVVPAQGGRGIVLSQNSAAGGFSALIFELSAVSNGYARIQSVKASGESYGDLVLNEDGGRVGIGRIPLVNDLEVEGSASKSTATAWLSNSDRRIKSDVRTVTGALATLEKIRPVAFRYTAEYRAAHKGITDREYLNVIAQEFAEVFPDAVQGSGERLPDGSEILQVDTYPATITAIAAIKELNAELKAVRKKCEALAGRVAELEGKGHPLADKNE